MKRKMLQFILVSSAMLLASSAMATNGYFTHGTGTANKALGGAGMALPQDALAGANNPASAVEAPEENTLSLAIFNPSRQYTVNGVPSGYPQTFGLTPGTVQSGTDYFAMPSFATNMMISPVSALSFSMIAHGGMNTDYDTNTFYGAENTGVDLAQMFFNTTYARKISPNHSLGLTAIVAYQRFEANGLEAFGMFSTDPTALTGNSHDDSYGFGVKIGYLGHLTDRLRVGASYSPKISMSEFDKYAGLFCEGGTFDIPASATIGFAFDATDAIVLVFDIQQIEYSGVNAVGHELMPRLLESPLGSHGGPGFGWDDMTAYKLGVQWAATPLWTLRAGYSTANQPIPESEMLFNILAPGVIEDHVTIGFSRDLGNGGRNFNFALMYALENTVSGPNPLEAPGQQTIELTMDEWEAEFSYGFRF